MADESDNLTSVFDFDNREALEKILKTTDALQAMGDSKSLDGLLGGLTKVTAAVGIVGATLYTLKAAFDAVLHAEEIKQINRQFELMSQNAGVATDTLRRGLIDAAKGLVDDTDLMRAANRALTELSGGAEKFPQLMEIARKSTAVFGGDAVQNFEAITHAIATGNTKGLKNIGITIDVDKAYEKYAKTLGGTASQLSEAGKQQAILNAVLEKGEKQTKNVVENIKPLTNAWQQLKVTVKETAEIFTLFFERTAGPLLSSFFQKAAEGAKAWKILFQAKFGEGPEKEAAGVELLNMRISGLTKTLEDQQKAKEQYEKSGDVLMTKMMQQNIDKTKSEIETLTAKVGVYNKALEQTSKKKKEALSDPSEPTPGLDKKKVGSDEAKFQHDLLKLKEDRVKEEMRLTKSLTEFDALNEKQKLLFRQETEAKVKEIASNKELTERQQSQLIVATRQEAEVKLRQMDIEALEKKKGFYREQMGMIDDIDQYEIAKEQEKANLKAQLDIQRQMIEQNKEMTDQQKKQAMLEQEQMYQMQITQIQDQAEMEREQITERWVKHGQDAATRFARGFASGSLQAQNSLRNFGAQGQMVFNAFTTQAGNAFMQLGEGGKKGSEILRGAVLGMIADIAQNYGQMLLAAGIWPPNPAALAAGAALLTLAGYLRSQARGGAQSMGGGGGTASGMGEIGGVPSSLAQSNLASEQQKQAKSVHVEVHGNIMDSDATRTRFAEIIRDSADATDFSIKRVGGVV